MNSTELINKAKDAFNELMHKNFDYRSFYNGYLAGYAARINEENKGKCDHDYQDMEAYSYNYKQCTKCNYIKP